MKNFIQDVINGTTDINSINDYIEKWHTGTSKKTLHKFLGMSRNQYCAWVEDANILSIIIDHYRS